MPKSRARKKRHDALAGIPQPILALAPKDWPDAKKAQWCRSYLDGAAGRPQQRKPGEGLGHWRALAYRQGKIAGSDNRPEISQAIQSQAHADAAKERKAIRLADDRHRRDANFMANMDAIMNNEGSLRAIAKAAIGFGTAYAPSLWRER